MNRLQNNKPQNKLYRFSVEGETEKWYLERIGELINGSDKVKRPAIMRPKVEKMPKKFIKNVDTLTTEALFHVCDVEGQSLDDTNTFENTLKDMGTASRMKGIPYRLAYSNYTFELWMILHKIDCYGCLSCKEDYLSFINQAFGISFNSLDEYKDESNFKRCLQQITLDDVYNAIDRAKQLMNAKTGDQEVRIGTYKYCPANPALSIHLVINRILKDCLR